MVLLIRLAVVWVESWVLIIIIGLRALRAMITVAFEIVVVVQGNTR